MMTLIFTSGTSVSTFLSRCMAICLSYTRSLGWTLCSSRPACPTTRPSASSSSRALLVLMTVSRVGESPPRFPRCRRSLGISVGQGPDPLLSEAAGRVERDNCLYSEVSHTGPRFLVSRLRASAQALTDSQH